MDRAGTLRVDNDGDCSTVTLRGDHDLSTAADLRDALFGLNGQRLVIVDFAECTFLDSTILGVLVSAARRAHAIGTRMVGVDATGIIRNALRVTAMSEFLLTRGELSPVIGPTEVAG